MAKVFVAVSVAEIPSKPEAVGLGQVLIEAIQPHVGPKASVVWAVGDDDDPIVIDGGQGTETL